MKKLAILLAMLVSSLSYAATELKTPDDVHAAFAKHRPMVIMFYTTWCPACKHTKPAYARVEKVLKGKADFYLMNSEKMQLRNGEHTALIIEAIPSFTAGKTEQEVRSGVNFREGGGDEADLLAYVKKALGII